MKKQLCAVLALLLAASMLLCGGEKAEAAANGRGSGNEANAADQTNSGAAEPEQTSGHLGGDMNTHFISTCTDHTAAVRADGTVVATGDNTYGQCDVSEWTDIVSVLTGDGYTIGLRSDGTVVATGDNTYGQCNVSEWTDIVSVETCEAETVGQKADGSLVVSYSEDDIEPEVFEALLEEVNTVLALSGIYKPMPFAMISNGPVFIKPNGRVFAYADYDDDLPSSRYGQNIASAWPLCYAHRYALAFVREDGTITAMRPDDDGSSILWIGTVDDLVHDWEDIASVAGLVASSGHHHVLGLKSDGSVISGCIECEGGACDCELCASLQSWRDIVAVTAAESHVVGLKAGGSVVAMGDNDMGQCDVDDWENIRTNLTDR